MKKSIILFFAFAFVLSCQTTQENKTAAAKGQGGEIKIKKDFKYTGEITPGKWLRDVTVPISYNGETSSAKIQIYFPKDYVKGKNFRTLIALPQYDDNMRDWEEGSLTLESQANRYRFVIVCPAMGKTIYETSYYPETTNKWSIVPGGRYVVEVLIPFLAENFGLAADKESTGIMGVVMGAHGAILIAATWPERFGAAAGISGFYDPTIMQNSRMIESVYGSYRKFQERWENDDNPLKMAERLAGVPVYIHHGGKMDAFQEGQSRIMAIKLKQLENKSSSYSITYSESKTGQYGWLYWRVQVPEVLAFFDTKLKE